MSEYPRWGDRVHDYRRHPEKQANGTITALRHDDDEIEVTFEDGEWETYSYEDFYGMWTDKFDGLWRIGG